MTQPCRKRVRPRRVEALDVQKGFEVSDLHHVGGVEQAAPGTADVQGGLHIRAEIRQQLPERILIAGDRAAHPISLFGVQQWSLQPVALGKLTALGRKFRIFA